MVFFTEKPRADVEGVFSHLTRDVPPRRFADPNEIMGICSYLASDDAAFAVGVVMPVDYSAAVADVSHAALCNIAAQ